MTWLSRACLPAAAALLTVLALPARADTELALGFADEIHGETAPIATLGWVGATRHPWEALIGHIESRDGQGLSRTPTTTFIGAAKRLTYRRWFISTGIALADTNNDNEVLSGPFQFMTGIGYGGERWSIAARHLSNASIRGNNRGETFVVVGFRF
jgi:hypothetical protein